MAIRRLAALAIVISLHCAAGAEIRLLDGRVIEGEIVSDPGADIVDVKSQIGGMSVTQHIPRDRIASIDRAATPRQKAVAAIAADRAALRDGGSAEVWWALVERAREAGDLLLARDLAQQVVVRDRHHEAARRLLGMAKVRGVWMRSNEASLSRGEVIHHGRYVSWDERERQLIDESKRLEEARQRQEEALAAMRARRYTAEGSAEYPPTLVPQSTYTYYEGPYHPYWRYGLPPRVSYWPGAYGYGAHAYGGSSYRSGSSVAVHGSGGGRNNSWSFSWRF